MNRSGRLAVAAAVKGPVRTALDLVQPELDQVERRLLDELAGDSAAVNRLVEHISQFGGKRLRPALLLLAGRAFGEPTADHVTLGVVVELIHMATLLHDDVLDHAGTRRKVPTLNSLAGNRIPILLGDVVYARAFALTTGLQDRAASVKLAETTGILCTGEIEQNDSRGRLDLSLAEYFRIIEFKTASLYDASCFLGAHYSGADAAGRDAVAGYGRALGMAFQIIDDCLDLVGDEERVGKSLGTDLDEQKLTLPLIHLVERLDERQFKTFEDIVKGGAVGSRRALLREHFDLAEDLEYARRTAVDFIEQARESLRGLPPSAARDALEAVAQYVLERDL